MRENARIVVEGMDGAGKSTLITKILGRYGPDVSYLVRNDLGPDRDLRAFWVDALGSNRPGRFAVHDRFFYSELVYGPILRGRLTVDGGILSYVSEYLRHYSFLTYVRPRSGTIRSGLAGREQLKGVAENFDRLLLQYDEVMMAEVPIYQDRFFHYDYERADEDDVLMEKLDAYLGV